MTETIAVLGAGSWGSALALLLARNGYPTRLWGHDPKHIALLQQRAENPRHLPGIAFPPLLTAWSDLNDAVKQADAVLVTVPSHAFGATLNQLQPHLPPDVGLAWATKGLEHGSGRFLHEVARDITGAKRPLAMISGPSFAREVAIGLPTAITVAATYMDFADYWVGLLHGPTMRAYSSDDVVGVELGGAVKNVMAIAAGIADGLGFGANARAALITRGLAEMVRLGEAVGGRRDTFMGLTGVGDLLLTCTDDQSRNRRFGLAIGRGQTADEARTAIGQVVEGMATAREIMRLAHQYGIEMPITEQVDRILHQGLDPRQAVEALLAREPKRENA